MVKVNQNFLQLQNNYLFSEIAHRVKAFRQAHPQRRVISLGIGDVTRPLSKAVVEALLQATREMGQAATFRGYGPEQGYPFLRTAIAEHDYTARGLDISADEIFISDGAKSDLGNFQELFAVDSSVAVTDPVYPVYVDSNVMAGRERIIYLPCTQENNFVPSLPDTHPDLIYLCSPNNPTGTALNKIDLQKWVAYARREGCVILYDSAYEAFITEPDIPHSIYEIEGAKEVAVEFRSFSKTAGFTGLRCAYTVIPRALTVEDGQGGRIALHRLWNRRQTTKYNGCPYIVQRAAEAVYSAEGRAGIAEDLAIYRSNALQLATAMRKLGLAVFGGVNAPYLWVAVPQGWSSWDFFKHLLEEAALVCTPGAGFGKAGEGYVRLTAFGTPEDTQEAIQRLKQLSL